jgi:hypothetical protein
VNPAMGAATACSENPASSRRADARSTQDGIGFVIVIPCAVIASSPSRPLKRPGSYCEGRKIAAGAPRPARPYGGSPALAVAAVFHRQAPAAAAIANSRIVRHEVRLAAPQFQMRMTHRRLVNAPETTVKLRYGGGQRAICPNPRTGAAASLAAHAAAKDLPDDRSAGRSEADYCGGATTVYCTEEPAYDGWYHVEPHCEYDAPLTTTVEHEGGTE